MTILLESEFNIGDKVCSVLDEDNERPSLITGIGISKIDNNGVVIYYYYDCIDINGTIQGYKPEELKSYIRMVK